MISEKFKGPLPLNMLENGYEIAQKSANMGLYPKKLGGLSNSTGILLLHMLLTNEVNRNKLFTPHHL